MNEPDNFISRWSRRKQEAAVKPEPSKDDVAQEAGEGAPDVAATKTALSHPAADNEPGKSEPGKSEPVFDLSKLPSLDSIGPNTDVRMFMQPGVPGALSRAALRRAWSADPAIRDFIGLSENSWDFTAPNSITGFGPLLPTDNVKEMLARIFNEGPKEEPKVAEAESAASQQVEDASEKNPEEMQNLQASAPPEDSNLPENASANAPEPISHRNIDAAASQYESGDTSAEEAPGRRRHGGALPT